MKKFINFSLFVLTFNSLSAQKISAATGESFSFAGVKPSQGSIMYGYDNTPIEVEGSVYADSTWKNGGVILVANQNDTTTNLRVRYDTNRGELDILHNNKILAATPALINGFYYYGMKANKKHHFVKVETLPKNEAELKGFVEVLSTGSVSLYKYYYTETKQPDYNPVLNVGSKNYTIIQKIALYYSKNNILQKLEPMKLNNFCKKYFEERAIQVEDFAKQQQLSTKKEEDLIKIFQFFNSQP